MFNLPSIFGYDEAIDMKELFVNSIIQNCKCIDMNTNWPQLCFLEASILKSGVQQSMLVEKHQKNCLTRTF